MSVQSPPEPTSILWQRLDRPGHEAARVTNENGEWRLQGAAVFVHDDLPVRLDYLIECDAAWRTSSASVSGWIGRANVDVRVVAAADGWRLNGKVVAGVFDCIDVDLNFSPVTNLPPIRRLNLRVGQEAAVRAAWLRFPSFQLEVLDQRYKRTAVETYEYESASGFRTEIRVNGIGLPLEYAGVWRSAASTLTSW